MKTAAEIRRKEQVRFGNNIRSWRVHLDWSQEQLGKEISMHQSNLSDIENGMVQASDETIDKLAKAFGVAPMDLVRFVSPPEKKLVKTKD